MPKVKREAKADEDVYPSDSISVASSPSPRKKAKATSSKSTPAKKKTATPKSSPGEKKMGNWAGDELLTLFRVMCPKVSVKWDDVARQIPGRDAKACQNKWARMQKNLDTAIMNMGE